jgi:hypothetical protein
MCGHVAADSFDLTDDFMTGHNRDRRLWQFAVDDMQIGTAHAACLDSDEHVVWPGGGLRDLNRLEAAGASSHQGHRSHWNISMEWNDAIQIDARRTLREENLF